MSFLSSHFHNVSVFLRIEVRLQLFTLKWWLSDQNLFSASSRWLFLLHTVYPVIHHLRLSIPPISLHSSLEILHLSSAWLLTEVLLALLKLALLELVRVTNARWPLKALTFSILIIPGVHSIFFSTFLNSHLYSLPMLVYLCWRYRLLASHQRLSIHAIVLHSTVVIA